MHDEAATMDDHDAVDGLGDLRQEVTGDKDRLPLRGERPKEVPQPPHPLGIEAVGGLVQQ
jgi:hypothetical protein